MVDKRIREAISAHVSKSAEVCNDCPEKVEGPTVEYDKKFHSGCFLTKLLASVRVKVACGACNGQKVIPEKGVVEHTDCSRFKRASQKRVRDEAWRTGALISKTA